MATLEQRVAALEAILSGDVYQSAFDGAVIDSSVGRAKPGGELDSKISELDGKVLSHAERHSSSGSDPIAPSSIGAAAATHASQHGASGSDPITPAAIGAVKKSGDTMTGNLSIMVNAVPSIILNSDGGTANIFKNASAAVEDGTHIQDHDNNGHSAVLILKGSAGLDNCLAVNLNGAIYPVLHTGNLSTHISIRSKAVEYTGTGTTSVSVAVGFVPRLVVVQEVLSVSSSGSPSTMPLVFNGVGQAIGLYRNANSGDLDGFVIDVTAFGETISWTGSDDKEANNWTNTTCRLTAIG